MSDNQSDPMNMNQTELMVELGKIQIRLDLKMQALVNRERELRKLRSEMRDRETQIRLRGDTIVNLRIELEKTKAELNRYKPSWEKTVLALFASLLFGVATILFNLGNSMFTAVPPEPKGNMIIWVAVILYFVASAINLVMVGGSN